MYAMYAFELIATHKIPNCIAVLVGTTTLDENYILMMYDIRFPGYQ